MKRLNSVNSESIINKISERLPHIEKSKIKIVFHLFQREIKIALIQDKVLEFLGFASWSVQKGYAKKFFCVFHKEKRWTVLPSKIGTSNLLSHLKIAKYFKKGKAIENVEFRSLRTDQAYAYRTAQRAFTKAKQNQ